MLERQAGHQRAVLGTVEVARAIHLAIGGEHAGAESPARQGPDGALDTEGDLVRAVAQQFREVHAKAVASVAAGVRMWPLGRDRGDQPIAGHDLDPQAPAGLIGGHGPALDRLRGLEPDGALDQRGSRRRTGRRGRGRQAQAGEQAAVEGHRAPLQGPGVAAQPHVEESHAPIEIGFRYGNREARAASLASFHADGPERSVAVGGGLQPGRIAVRFGLDPAGDGPLDDAGQPPFDHTNSVPAPLQQARLVARWPLIDGPDPRSKPPGRPSS